MKNKKVILTIINKTLKPFEALDIQIKVTNISNQNIEIPSWLGYYPSFNGVQYGGTTGKKSLEKYGFEPNILQPKETIIYTYKQFIELEQIPKQNIKKQGLLECDFKLIIQVNDTYIFNEKIFIDLHGLKNLIAKDKTPSNYYAYGSIIFYYSPYSRAYEDAIKRLKGKVDEYQIINKNYVINSKQVYRDGRLVRGVKSEGFKIYNKLFAGNNTTILTPYGDAKVEDPKTFKVLDNGMDTNTNPIHDGYLCGYAIDDTFAYCFDESTSTKHALRIKSCKNPQKLISLEYGFAKDDKYVYYIGKKVPKIKPENFKILNNKSATDGDKTYKLSDLEVY